MRIEARALALSAINLIASIVFFFLLLLSAMRVCARNPVVGAEVAPANSQAVDNQAKSGVAPLESGGYTMTWTDGRLYP